MNKGNIGAIMAVAVVTVLVGLVVIDSIAAPVLLPTTVTNESLGTVYNGTTDTLANTCLTAAPTFYDWTNGTAIAAGQYLLTPELYPHRTTQSVAWATGSFDHNDTVVTADYTYGCNYGSTSAFRAVMENAPIIFALGILAIAGLGWVMLA